jgi:hypothetical protein
VGRDDERKEAVSVDVGTGWVSYGDLALMRIADTLDDYMEMSLSAQKILVLTQTSDPDMASVYAPVIDALAAITKRRSERTYP